MNFWHMQLHAGDRSKYQIDVIKKILTEKSIIGLGDPNDGWTKGKSSAKYFKEKMGIGDVVAVRDGGKPIALVKVVGDCEYVEPDKRNSDFDWFAYSRKIKVLDFYKGDGKIKYVRKAVMRCASDDKETTKFVKDWYKTLSEGAKMKNVANMLKESKNIIFNGAPGTGKTYLAKQIALRLIFPEKEHIESEGDLNADELKTYRDRCGFVQFHQSYDYTDFVEGLRPTPPDKSQNIGFELKDGVFREFCDRARNADKGTPYIFIIDEINRGEISRIFGELFFSIDPDYRGEKGRVMTQYSNMRDEKYFYVPENVYIVGTMNDIDRGVESFDFAMRRRFTFKEITADESAKNMGVSGESEKMMKKLNEAIVNIGGLNSSYHIGAAYFKKYEKEGVVDYDGLWEYHIWPLLKEYLRGTRDSDDKLKKLEDSCGPNE